MPEKSEKPKQIKRRQGHSAPYWGGGGCAARIISFKMCNISRLIQIVYVILYLIRVKFSNSRIFD